MKTTPILLALSTASTLLAMTHLPEPGIPQSCGVQMKNDTFNVETIQAVHDLGFRIIRRGMYWSAVEKEKGVYKFDAFDAQMDKARDLGLTVIVTLFGNNTSLYDNAGLGAIVTEESRRGFAAFAAEAARHYKGRNVVFEIWNEPNVRTFWRKKEADGRDVKEANSKAFADEYSALVNEAVPAMLKADPDCFVVAGSVSNYWQPSYNWTEFCFQNGVLKSGIRGWSVHPYGVKTPEEFQKGHDITRALLRKYGAPDLPMVDTERGFTSAKREEGWSGGNEARAFDYQAWHIVRQFLVDQMCGIQFTSWYELKGNEGFSLYENGSPRPALAAFQTMVKELSGYRYDSRIPSDNPRDYLLVFQNPAGERKLVAWTSPAPGGSPDETLEHAVVLPAAGSKPLASAGLLGKPGAAPVGLALSLSGAPQYIALASNAALGPAVSIGPAATPSLPVATAPAGFADLGLFAPDTAWEFLPNTGKGSFTLGTDPADNRPLGSLAWDFSESKAKGTPYVIASVPADIASAAALSLSVRTPIAQQVTVRVTDATGQTLQTKLRARGTKQWETLNMPLNKKLEHWGGANDGKAHFPLKSISLSIPKPGDTLSGTIEISAIGTAN